MRIIGGELKGRRLAAWPRPKPKLRPGPGSAGPGALSSRRRSKGPDLRPMTDKARESLFNIISARGGCQRAFFLDLFSGTGSLAIEAISRGAAEAHAVERGAGSLKILEKNRHILSRPERLVIHRRDVFLFLRQAQAANFRLPASRPFSVIAADPPFSLRAGSRLMEMISKSRLFQPGALAALETGRGEELSRRFGAFRLFSRKEFSDKSLWLYEEGA